MVRSEIAPYESPVTGKPITSRRERREDLLRSGSIEWEPGLREHVAKRKADLFEADLRHAEQKVDETVRDLHASGRI